MPRLLETASDVWEHLLNEGGLQPESWDEALVEELRVKLGLGDGPFAGELTTGAVPTERLVYALFAALEPFAGMMGDLLSLFERQGIERSGGSAEIVFDFEAPERPPLRFDLEAFRRTREIWSRVMAPTVELHWIEHHAWTFIRVLQDGASVSDWAAPRPATAGWVDAYWERGDWPPTPLGVPLSGSAELDRELGRAAQIWGAIVELMRARLVNRDGLRDASYAQPAGGPTNADGEDRALNLLAWIESDYFLLQLASAIADAADAAKRTRDASQLAEDLRAFLDQHHFLAEPVEVLVRGLLDVLDLPIWRQRHELYAAWVLVEFVAAAPAPARLIASAPGVLRFPFRATQMARLHGCNRDVTVWSEVRTPLTDPTGASRKDNVQPDYSVVVDTPDPRANPHASVLEIECKQYKRAANRSFVAALTDYARARPAALVLLVSHGPLNRDRLVAAVPADVRDRTDAIAHLHPRDAPARARFAELVDAQLRPLCPRPVLTCRLEWQRPPADLDLHLFITDLSGRHHVNFEQLGTPDEPPFAVLAEDIQTPGTGETLTIEQWLEDATYVIAVHAYSHDAPLAGSGARVTLEQSGLPPVTADVPTSGHGPWWHVAEVRRAPQLTLLGRLRPEEP